MKRHAGLRRHVMLSLPGRGSSVVAFDRLAIHSDRFAGLHHTVLGLFAIGRFHRVFVEKTLGVRHLFGGRAFADIAIGINGDIGILFKAGVGAVGIRIGSDVLLGIITLGIL